MSIHTTFPRFKEQVFPEHTYLSYNQHLSGGYSYFSSTDSNGYATNQTQMARMRRYRRRNGRSKTKRRRFKRRRRTLRRRIGRIWKFMRNKGLRNIETKMVRVNQSATSDPTISTRVTTLSKTHGIVLKKVLTDIPNGTKAGERIGQKVFIKNCKLKFYCQAPPVKPTGSSITVPSEVFIRFMIVREKEALGSSVSQFDPTVYHVHQDNELDDNVSPNQPSTQDSRMAFIQEEWKYYNSKFADNYKILWRKTIKVSNEEGADHLTRLVKCNIRVNQPAHWDSSNARGDGHVYLFYWCDVTSFDNQGAEVLGHIPLVWLTGRTTFTDI